MSGISIEKPSGTIPPPLEINVSEYNNIGTYATSPFQMELMAVRIYFDFNLEGPVSGPVAPPIVIALDTYKLQLGWVTWTPISVSLINTGNSVELDVPFRYNVVWDDENDPTNVTILFYLQTGLDYDDANFIFYAIFQKTS